MLFIELQYFPPVIAYSALIKNIDIEFCLYENYQRRSFRNRCIIAGANGPIALSIPIAGGRNKKAVYKDVKIDNSTNWQQLHWRSIFSAYGNSPWFFHFADSLEKLFSQKAEYLFDWNLLCLDWINRSLGKSMTPLNFPGVTLGGMGNPWRVGTPLEGSGNLEHGQTGDNVNREEDIHDWRNRILPANFQDEDLGPFPVYTQVFEERFGFQPNMSILDFILCCGKGQLNKLLT
jgi:hypothetical protein